MVGGAGDVGLACDVGSGGKASRPFLEARCWLTCGRRFILSLDRMPVSITDEAVELEEEPVTVDDADVLVEEDDDESLSI